MGGARAFGGGVYWAANLRFAQYGDDDPDGNPRPLCAPPGGDFPDDRSGYGLVNVAGNAAEWCTGSLPLPGKQPLRAGSIHTNSARAARLTYRLYLDPAKPPPTAAGFRTAALVPILMAVVAACAVWTNMIDGRSMGDDGGALAGVSCDECTGVTKLRPWSL